MILLDIIKRTVRGKEVTLERPLTFARWKFIVDPSGKIYRNVSVDVAEDTKAVIDFLRTKRTKRSR